MPWFCENRCSQCCACCEQIKGSSLNLDLMVSGNYVMIMIMLMFIDVCKYICMYVMYDRVVMDHGCLMLMFICIYMCMYVIV